MDWLKQNQQKSQLGQILIGKKLISEQQLNDAIVQQSKTGQRLGEVLAEWKVITDRQIQGAMRRQRNLRLAATVATALLGPLQAYAAVIAAPVTVAAARVLSPERGSGASGHLQALSEEEMGEVAAQGLPEEALREHVAMAQQWLESQAQRNSGIDALGTALHMTKGDGVQVLGELAKLFNPLSMVLGAQTTIKDVVYDPANSQAILNKDGSVTLRLPSTIGLISFQNIRVKGATSGPSFGSIDIKNIDLRGTTITISSH